MKTFSQKSMEVLMFMSEAILMPKYKKCVATYLISSPSILWSKLAVFRFVSSLFEGFCKDLLFRRLLPALSPARWCSKRLVGRVCSQLSSLKQFLILVYPPSISTSRTGAHQPQFLTSLSCSVNPSQSWYCKW